MSGIEEMDFGMSEKKEMSSTTMKELHFFCESYMKLKKQAEALEESLANVEASKKEFGNKIMTLLTEFKMPSLKNEFGNFIISNRFTVPTPKTPEDKEAFFQYLKARDIFETMVSVNSQTLNGWYRQEMDAALERGEVNFSVPGLAEPNFVQTLTVRKA